MTQRSPNLGHFSRSERFWSHAPAMHDVRGNGLNEPRCALQFRNISTSTKGHRTVRVALAFYGLARHPCPASTIADAFLEPLRVAARGGTTGYDVDVLVAANLANASWSPRSGESGLAAIDSEGNYLRFRPCAASAVDQARRGGAALVRASSSAAAVS